MLLNKICLHKDIVKRPHDLSAHSMIEVVKSIFGRISKPSSSI